MRSGSRLTPVDQKSKRMVTYTAVLAPSWVVPGVVEEQPGWCRVAVLEPQRGQGWTPRSRGPVVIHMNPRELAPDLDAKVYLDQAAALDELADRLIDGNQIPRYRP